MFALVLIVGLVPHSVVLEDRCDVVEVNHFYNEQGGEIFTQVIFWDWSDVDECNRVVAWRLLKRPSQWPSRKLNGFAATWFDHQVLRRVRSRWLVETWTQVGGIGDPELEDRKFLPSEERRGLRK